MRKVFGNFLGSLGSGGILGKGKGEGSGFGRVGIWCFGSHFCQVMPNLWVFYWMVFVFFESCTLFISIVV